jgi:hypothetical protein
VPVGVGELGQDGVMIMTGLGLRNPASPLGEQHGQGGPHSSPLIAGHFRLPGPDTPDRS